MEPTKGKILIKFVTEPKKANSGIVIAGIDGKEKKQDVKELKGEFYIEKLGKDCDVDLKAGQKITMKEHHYKINVTKKESKPEETGLWYFLIEEHEVWAYE